MPEKRLPHSVRKFLRRRKAEIRRQFLSGQDAEEKIMELVRQTFQAYAKGERAAAEVPSAADAAKAPHSTIVNSH